MAGETIRYDITANVSDASRGFKAIASDSLLAARGARQLSDSLSQQSKTAQVAAGASLALAKSDKTLRDAEELLSASADETARNLKQQSRAAAEAAGATKIAAAAASGAGSGFGALATPIGAAVAAGVALAPVLLTVGAGLGGLGLAAYGASKNAGEMAKILGPLKTEFNSFSQSLQPEVLTLFGQGAHMAGEALHTLQPIAAVTGRALIGVLGQVDAEFRSQAWQDFFGFMRRTAGPDVQLLGGLIVDLTGDLPPLLIALQPVAEEFLKLADGTAKAAGGLERVEAIAKRTPDSINNVNTSTSGLEAAAKRAGEEVLNHLIPGFTNIISTGQKVAEHSNSAGQGIGKVYDAAQKAGPGVTALAASMGEYAGRVVSAANPTTTEAANLFVLRDAAGRNSSTGAAGAINRLNSAWEQFLGLSSGLIGAQLAVTGGLQTLREDAKKTGASFTGVNGASITLQQDFESNLLPSVQQVIGGMRQAHASSHDLAVVVSTDLKPAVDRGALANAGLRQQIFDMAREAGYTGPNKLKPLQEWIDRNAGSAQNAANKVNRLGGELAKLPANKTVQLTVRVAGTGGEFITSTTGAKGRVNVYPVRAAAAGWKVPGSGSGDTVPAMLTPGEAVVPKRLVPAVAPFLAANKVPGFAAGGIAGAVNALGSAAQPYFSDLNARVLASALSAVNKRVSSSLAATGAGGAGVARWAPVILQALAMLGQPAGLLGAVEHRMAQESGGNQRAINLTDINARLGDPSRGLMQVIGATFARYRNPSLPNDIYNPLANVYAALNYAEHAYPGRSLASVMLQAGGYDNGGPLKPGLTLAWNGTGRTEQVLPPGRGGGEVHVHLHNLGVIASQAETDRWIVDGINRAAKSSKLTWAFRHSPSAA